MGKLLHLPVAFMVVTSNSMQPALRPGDLVIGVSARVLHPRPGDIVVWCLPKALSTACIVHRLLRVSGSYAITKGDANPRPDPPIPLTRLRYRVALRVPVYAWVPLFIAAAAAYVVSSFRGLEWGRIPTGLVALTLLLSYLIFDAVVIGLSYVDPSPPIIARPNMTLEDVGFDPSSRIVTIHYSLGGYRIVVAYCVTSNYTALKARIVPGDTLAVKLPGQLLERLWSGRRVDPAVLPKPPARVLQILKLTCVLRLSGGVLVSDVGASFYWSEPRVRAVDGGVVVENDNPVPVKVRVTIIKAGVGAGVAAACSHVIPAASTWSCRPSGLAPGTYRFVVSYRFLGVNRSQVVEVHVKG